jgi:hypothetical protein
MIRKRITSALTAVFMMALLTPAFASAATVEVVSPDNSQGWTDISEAGGTATFVDGEAVNSPMPSGALNLKTTATNESFAGYQHDGEDTPLADIQLSYDTRQLSSSFEGGLAAYQLNVDLNDDGTVDTGLVYEPYWQNEESPDSLPVVNDEWQSWDVDAGSFWSTETYDGSALDLTAGAGGQPFYTLAEITEAYPDATIDSYAIKQGTYNPDYDILVDAVIFNETTYNFELEAAKKLEATSKDECKNGGWETFETQYKNQGDCVSSVASEGKAKGNPSFFESITETFRGFFN